MLYADANALLKLYVDEPDSIRAEEILHGDSDWVTAGHTLVEIRRNLARLLTGDALDMARQQFDTDWVALRRVELDAGLCEIAAELAEATGARTLDALHLGAASAVGAASSVAASGVAASAVMAEPLY